jgi:hypothetical protein
LSGPVTLTAIISAGRTVLGSYTGVESLRHNADRRFANLELEKMVARRSDRPTNEQFFLSGSTHGSPRKPVAAQRRL